MLGDLELKLFGLQSAALQGALDGRGEVFLLELQGRDIDGNGELSAELTLHRGDFLAGL